MTAVLIGDTTEPFFGTAANDGFTYLEGCEEKFAIGDLFNIRCAKVVINPNDATDFRLCVGANIHPIEIVAGANDHTNLIIGGLKRVCFFLLKQ